MYMPQWEQNQLHDPNWRKKWGWFHIWWQTLNRQTKLW